MSVNKAILVGNVGSDPDIRTFDNGTKVANFNFATSERYTNKNGDKVEDTEWHRISIFGKKAELIELYVKKGAKLYLEGQIKTRSWDDKDGNKRYQTEVVLNDFGSSMNFLGGKKQENSSAPVENTPNESAPDDDLPF